MGVQPGLEGWVGCSEPSAWFETSFCFSNSAIHTFSDCVSSIRLIPGVHARLLSHVAWTWGEAGSKSVGLGARPAVPSAPQSGSPSNLSLCSGGGGEERGLQQPRERTVHLPGGTAFLLCVYAGASAHRNPVINQNQLSWESEGPGQRPASYPGSLGCSLQPQAPGREAGDAQLSSSLLPRRPWVADSFQCPHQAEPGPLRPR